MMAVIGSDEVSEETRPVMLTAISLWIGHRNSDYMKALERISETDASAIASCVNEINFLVRHLPGRPTLFIDALSPKGVSKLSTRVESPQHCEVPLDPHDDTLLEIRDLLEDQKRRKRKAEAQKSAIIPKLKADLAAAIRDRDLYMDIARVTALKSHTIAPEPVQGLPPPPPPSKPRVSPVVGPVEPTLSAEGFKTAFNVAVQKNARPISASIEEPQRRASETVGIQAPNLSGWAEPAPPASLMDAIPGLKIRELEIDLDKAEEFMEHTIQTSPYAPRRTRQRIDILAKIAGLSVGHSTNLQSMLTHGVSAHHVMSNQNVSQIRKEPFNGPQENWFEDGSRISLLVQEKIEKSDAFVKLDHDPVSEMSKLPVGVKTAFIKIGVVPKGIEQSAIDALSQDWAGREDIEECFEDVSISDIRIITDCTPINDMFNMFPMELPKVRLFNLVNPNDDLFSIDASNGFHLIPIAEDFQKFFTFSLNGGFYRCTKLCFGVTFGPAIFSALMNLALAPMRALGYQLWAYIDDVFGWQSPDRRGRYRSASDAMRLLKLICFWLDITINKKKSVEPCKKLDVIGFTITSTFGSPDDPNMKVALAPSDANCRKIALKAQELAHKLTSCKEIPLKDFVELASKCTAFRAASRKLHASAITINAIIHEALKDKDGIPRKITKWLMTRSLTIGDQDLKEVQHHEHGQIEAQPKATDPTSGSPLGFIGTNEAHHLACTLASLADHDFPPQPLLSTRKKWVLISDAAVSEEKIGIAGTAFATDDVDETCFEHLLLRSVGGNDLAKNELIDLLNMLSAKDKAKAIQKTKLSIAHAEMEPLMAMLHSLGSKLSNGYLVWYCDNTNVVAATNKLTSRNTVLNDAARTLARFCQEKDLVVEAIYVPSVLNHLPDMASRGEPVCWKQSRGTFLQELVPPKEIIILNSVVPSAYEPGHTSPLIARAKQDKSGRSVGCIRAMNLFRKTFKSDLAFMPVSRRQGLPKLTAPFLKLKEDKIDTTPVVEGLEDIRYTVPRSKPKFEIDMIGRESHTVEQMVPAQSAAAALEIILLAALRTGVTIRVKLPQPLPSAPVWGMVSQFVRPWKEMCEITINPEKIFPVKSKAVQAGSLWKGDTDFVKIDVPPHSEETL
ncbi:hypothetical protein PCE1_003258 [Barthelona sp. PCE]